ncbi:unnamed protein product [Gongylonema pulchrum]|uniref:DUF397 domain-containing protein n=1 Tax=Gongylonema pulchrum TaxID=637853 RepID=A0A183D9T7_9BILA|nr:unnamed protein product [Gongylonema pulchrum]
MPTSERERSSGSRIEIAECSDDASGEECVTYARHVAPAGPWPAPFPRDNRKMSHRATPIALILRLEI